MIRFCTGSLQNVYPTKKETHHLELFNSQEDHKGKASLVYISAKVCQVLLRALHVFGNQVSIIV